MGRVDIARKRDPDYDEPLEKLKDKHFLLEVHRRYLPRCIARLRELEKSLVEFGMASIMLRPLQIAAQQHTGLATTIRVRGKWNPAISGLAIVGEEVPPIIECIERRRQRGWDSGPCGSLKTPTSTPKKSQSDAVSASS